MVEYHGRKPTRVHTVLVSTQHRGDVSQDQIREDVIEHVVQPVIPDTYLDAKTVYHVNPTGGFVKGGPAADCGMTGRKIIVDTYGGRGRHGGGAFSGKDPSKVERSATYAARWIAKNIVAAGLAEECEVRISYAIGVADSLSVHVDSFDTGAVEGKKLIQVVERSFDLRPAAIIDRLDLLKPRYRAAAYGHFGREEPEFTWEKTDVAEDLREDAGL